MLNNNVVELRCNPPITTDIYMTYQCPNGFTYGSKCNLRCMGRFPLVGNETFVCEKNSTSDPPSTYWDKGGFEPFCKRKWHNRLFFISLFWQWLFHTCNTGFYDKNELLVVSFFLLAYHIVFLHTKIAY